MSRRMGQPKYDAFESLYEREQKHVYIFALARTRDRDVALDIVSEVFEAAWQARADLLNPWRFDDVRLHRWCMAVTRARIAVYWKYRVKRAPITFSQAFAVVPAEQTMALVDDGGIEAIVEACDSAMAAAMLRAALRACTPTQLQIIEMRYGMHLPEPIVAERLGLTRAAYTKRHNLLMQHLATVLGDVSP